MMKNFDEIIAFITSVNNRRISEFGSDITSAEYEQAKQFELFRQNFTQLANLCIAPHFDASQHFEKAIEIVEKTKGSLPHFPWGKPKKGVEVIEALTHCEIDDRGYGASDEVYQAWADALGWPIWKLIRVHQLSKDYDFKFTRDFIQEAIRVASLPKDEFKRIERLGLHWGRFAESLEKKNNTEVPAMNFESSSPSNPCPVCTRSHDDGCQIASDGKTVLCRSKAHNGSIPQPPDEINGYKFTGKINSSGVLDRAVYVLVTEKKTQQQKQEFTFNYPDGEGKPCVRTRRVDPGNGKKKMVWQEYWIEDKQLIKFRTEECWVKLSQKDVKSGKATKEERAIYEQHQKELAAKVHLWRIEEALQLHKMTGIPLFIVEGETTAKALMKIGIPATSAIGGAKKFNQYGFENYKADLQAFESVVICPDCDQDGFEHAEQIHAVRSDAEFLYANPTHPRWNQNPWQSGYDLKNWIEEGADKEQILLAIGPKREVSAVQIPVATEENENSEETQYEITDAAATPDHHLNKYFFKEGNGDYCTMDGAWFHHNGENAWNHVDDEEMQKVVSRELKKLYIAKTERIGKEYVERHIHKFGADRYVTSSFKFNQKDLAIPQSQRPDPTRYMNFLNGVLDIQENKFMPYSRNLYLTSQIQADYHVGVSECPGDLQAFINSAYGNHKTELIRAVIRYFIDPSIKYGYFVHLIGPSGSGKGTLIRAIGDLLGNSYKALNEFDVLNSAEKRHQSLTGARMVAFPDVTVALGNLGAFYELVDNGALAGRPLFSSNTFTKKWNARFILGSTQPMAFEKSDTGWDRRCIPISTVAREGAIDNSWADKLSACMPQAVSWVMGLTREETLQILASPVQYAPDYQILKDMQSITSDSVQAFIDSCLVPSDDVEPVSKATIYGYYKAFCDSNKLGAKGFSNFCSRIKSTLGDLFETPRSSKWIAGKTVNVPAMFQRIDLVSEGLFSVKAMPSGEELPPERAEYVCNATRQSEGGLDLFRAYSKSLMGAKPMQPMQLLSKNEKAGEMESPHAIQPHSSTSNNLKKNSNKEEGDHDDQIDLDLVYRGQKVGEMAEGHEGPTTQLDRDQLHRSEAGEWVNGSKEDWTTPDPNFVIPVGTVVLTPDGLQGVVDGKPNKWNYHPVKISDSLIDLFLPNVLSVPRSVVGEKVRTL